VTGTLVIENAHSLSGGFFLASDYTARGLADCPLLRQEPNEHGNDWSY